MGHPCSCIQLVHVFHTRSVLLKRIVRHFLLLLWDAPDIVGVFPEATARIRAPYAFERGAQRFERNPMVFADLLDVAGPLRAGFQKPRE